MSKRCAHSRSSATLLLGAALLVGACSSDGSVSPSAGGSGPSSSSGGGAGEVGAAGVGGGDGGAADGGGGAPHVVLPCDSVAARGTWEQITPPVAPLPGAEPCPYGGDFVVNPKNTAELYVGSCNQGIWKSSDCGASWLHVNTGTNGSVLDAGRQWTFAIDPDDPLVLYTNSGYGATHNGAFKSIDGGVNWQELWPPADPDLASIVEYNFVGLVALDPLDSQHLLVSFHAKCAAPHPEACFAESSDGGETFQMVDGRPEWVGGEGQFVYFLDSSDTWLWGSQSNGLWRTEDGGDNWTAVTDGDAQGHGAGQLYRATDGTFYLPVLEGILRSPDGITWTIVPNSGSVMNGLTGNGTTMYASRGFPWDPSDDLYLPFWSSPENDGLVWTQLDSPTLSNGGKLIYDGDHDLLYSSNLGAGVWRVAIR